MMEQLSAGKMTVINEDPAGQALLVSEDEDGAPGLQPHWQLSVPAEELLNF